MEVAKRLPTMKESNEHANDDGDEENESVDDEKAIHGTVWLSEGNESNNIQPRMTSNDL